MKRFVLALALIFISLTSFGQGLFSLRDSRGGAGIVAGFTSSSVSINDLDPQSVNGFHIGLACNTSLGGGFYLQPEILYNVKGTVEKTGGAKLLDTTVGYLEIPVQIQWGFSFESLIRPYVFAEPFLGFGVNTKTNGASNNWDLMNRMGYGLGLGAGVQIFGIQVSGRYFWNFGDLYDADGNAANAWDSVKSGVHGLLNGQKTYSGFSLSAAIFF